MSKYYVVKIGRVPGIYLSWKDCETQVKGFPCAKYKKFSNKDDAESWFNDVEKKQSEDYDLEIWTDGSDKSGRCGFGAFSKFDGKEFCLSGICTKELLQSYDIFHMNVSNPTAEFIAFVEVLKHLNNIKGRKCKILFWIDYVGVGNWIDGTWKAKEKHIINILNVAKQLLSQLKDNGIVVFIKHVEGHSNNYGNDMADKLAGSGIVRNEFDLLTQLLMK